MGGPAADRSIGRVVNTAGDVLLDVPGSALERQSPALVLCGQAQTRELSSLSQVE